MTKRTITRNFSIPNTTDQTLINTNIADHLREVTNDLADMLDGGTSFDNLNATVKDFDIVSGVSFNVGGTRRSKNVLGMQILLSYGATITSVSSSINSQSEGVMTIVCTPERAKVKVAVYGI